VLLATVETCVVQLVPNAIAAWWRVDRSCEFPARYSA